MAWIKKTETRSLPLAVCNIPSTSAFPATRLGIDMHADTTEHAVTKNSNFMIQYFIFCAPPPSIDPATPFTLPG